MENIKILDKSQMWQKVSGHWTQKCIECVIEWGARALSSVWICDVTGILQNLNFDIATGSSEENYPGILSNNEVRNQDIVLNWLHLGVSILSVIDNTHA